MIVHPDGDGLMKREFARKLREVLEEYRLGGV